MTGNRRVSNAEMVAELEELIKKYNKKPEKKIKKKELAQLFKELEVIVPMKADFDESDIFEEEIDNVSLHPDIVTDDMGARLIPVFTSYFQMPVEYMDNFSFVRMEASAVYSLMNESEDLNGIVLNPYTECNLELKKKKHADKKKTETRSYSKATDLMPEAMIIYKNKKYLIDKTPFIIGRENSNIDIPESYISKIHVVISCKDGRFRVADYASTNGTALNGTPLKPKVYYELCDGYEIELAEKENMVVYIN